MEVKMEKMEKRRQRKIGKNGKDGNGGSALEVILILMKVMKTTPKKSWKYINNKKEILRSTSRRRTKMVLGSQGKNALDQPK
jgi:hypothetical protein